MKVTKRAYLEVIGPAGYTAEDIPRYMSFLVTDKYLERVELALDLCGKHGICSVGLDTDDMDVKWEYRGTSVSGSDAHVGGDEIHFTGLLGEENYVVSSLTINASWLYDMAGDPRPSWAYVDKEIEEILRSRGLQDEPPSSYKEPKLTGQGSQVIPDRVLHHFRLE